MKQELDKAIAAISYFLAGTFMLQLLADKTFDNVPSRVRVAIEYLGIAFLFIGVLLALTAIPYLSKRKWVKRIYDRTYGISVFPLFLVCLSAIVVTGLPRYPLITVTFFYVIIVGFLIYEISQIMKAIKHRSRSLSGVRGLLLAAGIPLLWINFVGYVFEVKLPYSTVILVIGIVFTASAIALLLIPGFLRLRDISKRKKASKIIEKG